MNSIDLPCNRMDERSYVINLSLLRNVKFSMLLTYQMSLPLLTFLIRLKRKVSLFFFIDEEIYAIVHYMEHECTFK